MAARLDDQARGRELLALAAAESAPADLRRRVAALAEPRARRRPRFAIGGALAAGLAALAVLALVILPGGGPGPSVAQAVALGAAEPTDPAPAVRADRPALLQASLGGVAFPAWAREFGWRAAGQRADRLGGRSARTVFYEKDGRTVAYTIVSGDALEPPADAATTTRGGVRFAAFERDGISAVSWERGGRTCVLSGPGVAPDVLLKLAAWRGGGAVEF